MGNLTASPRQNGSTEVPWNCRSMAKKYVAYKKPTRAVSLSLFTNLRLTRAEMKTVTLPLLVFFRCRNRDMQPGDCSL